MTDTRTSFVRALCVGEIEEDLIVPFPSLDPVERETLQGVIDAVDQLLEPHEEDFRTWDAEGELPADFVEELKAFGLFSLVIPEAAGGLGFGAAAYSRTLQQIARHDASVAVTVGAHSSIGMRGLLLYGTEDQRARYYEKLATGELVAAFCLTEAEAGSDAASVRTTARKDGDDWVLNGTKVWITNGGIADFFTVFAKTGEADERARLTAFLVTRDMDGVSTGPHEDKMGLRASSTTSVFLDNVRVPAANVLGPLGGGFKVAMNILNSGRSGLGGGTVGAMKRLIERSSDYATNRHQFQRPISEYGLIKEKVGQMMVDCYASEACVSIVAAMSDQGLGDTSVEAAISKVFATEALARTADEALQVAGGNGYMREYPYERIVRDCRINRIFEGTNEVLRLFIALSVMNDVGKQLADMADSLKGVFDDPIKGFGVLGRYATRRAAWATGISREHSQFTQLHPALKQQAAIFEEGTRHLAISVDRVLRKHGKNIIGKQFASKRLAEIMIDLFVLGCVLSRVSTSIQAQGVDATAHEREIAKVFASQARRRLRKNLAMIDDNDDESIKGLADHAFETGRYPWDIL